MVNDNFAQFVLVTCNLFFFYVNLKKNRDVDVLDAVKIKLSEITKEILDIHDSEWSNSRHH